MFAIAFLRTEDYVNPQNYDANDHEIVLVNFSLNDVGAKKMKEVIE